MKYYPCDFGYLVLSDGYIIGFVEEIPASQTKGDK